MSHLFLSFLSQTPVIRHGVCWGENDRVKLVQHTCVLMPHRVSDDPTEDDPAGHADGNSTGTRERRELWGKR